MLIAASGVSIRAVAVRFTAEGRPGKPRPQRGDAMMLMLIYEDERAGMGSLTPSRQKMWEYMKFTDDIKKSGNYIGGNPLKPTRRRRRCACGTASAHDRRPVRGNERATRRINTWSKRRPRRRRRHGERFWGARSIGSGRCGDVTKCSALRIGCSGSSDPSRTESATSGAIGKRSNKHLSHLGPHGPDQRTHRRRG
jgi:hypothetical protein